MQQATGLSRWTTAAAACLSVLGLAGCRQDMHNQPKFYPQRSTTFYADGRSVRPQVTGTIARGQEDEGSYFRTGMINGAEGDGLPMPLTQDLIMRGQEKYNVYCTACHSRVGNGKGMIVMRGYFQAGNFHTERLRSAPLGHFYNVIANGYGAMPDYSGQIEPEDRWAIAAYVRALQLSQHATTVDAGGAKIEQMSTVEKEQGLAPGFISDWQLPATSGAIQQQTPTAMPTNMPPLSSTPQPSASPTPGSTPQASPNPMPAAAAAMGVPAASLTKANPKTTPLATTPPAAGKPASAVGATDTKATAPSKAAPVASAGDVAAGEKLYLANCSACHQANRQGMAAMGVPSLVGIVGRVGAAHIHSVTTTGIVTGKLNMPSFTGKLTSEDVDKVIAYLAASK